MRPALAIVVMVTLGACAPTRERAPEDLDGLLRFLYEHHDDPDALHEGMENLAPWLDGVGRTEEGRAGYQLTPLTEEEVDDITRPDRDLEVAFGVAVAGVSRHRIEPHAEITLLPDQIYTDPRAHTRYDRTIIGGDPSQFLLCADDVRTVNDISKTKIGVTIPYVLHKDFAWVHLDEDRRATVARSWVQESSCSANGVNCVLQSYSVDLWYASDDVDTVRLTATWNEITSAADAFLSHDQLVNLAVNGMLLVYEETDAFLDEYPGP